MADQRKEYVLYVDGHEYQPFTSLRTLNECIAIAQKFEPNALIAVETFVKVSEGVRRVDG